MGAQITRSNQTRKTTKKPIPSIIFFRKSEGPPAQLLFYGLPTPEKLLDIPVSVNKQFHIFMSAKINNTAKWRD